MWHPKENLWSTLWHWRVWHLWQEFYKWKIWTSGWELLQIFTKHPFPIPRGLPKNIEKIDLKIPLISFFGVHTVHNIHLSIHTQCVIIERTFQKWYSELTILLPKWKIIEVEKPGCVCKWSMWAFIKVNRNFLSNGRIIRKPS